MEEWFEVKHTKPPLDVTVETAIIDERGFRVKQKLKIVAGSGLWWLPDMRMYVYYTPTHWKPVNP